MLDWSAVEAVGTWATALVAVGGIIFVRRQLQQVERTIRGDTHERLTTESFEVLKFLASEPKSYPYFYEGKNLEEVAKFESSSCTPLNCWLIIWNTLSLSERI
jgi:hypothetical protein